MSAIKFHLSTSQDKDLDDDYPGRRAEMNENEEEDEPGLHRVFSMSPLRLTMFLLSILASISAICVFLWAIPCDLATCSAHRSEKSLDDIMNTTSTMLSEIVQSTFTPLTVHDDYLDY